MKFFKKTKIIIILVLMLFSFGGDISARSLLSISDFISSSRPGYPANHTIIFKTTEAVPPGGKIKISPEPGQFLIPSGLSYLDVDFATSDEREGEYIERNLFSFPIISADGVSVVSGSAAPFILITLRNSLGILAGEYVRIKIGDIAVYEELGSEYIYNPNTVNSYKIKVETLNTASALIDYAEPMVAIVNPITMSSYAAKIRSRGSPSGTLAFGTTVTILSLATNYQADCRYSTSSSTPYVLMTDTFSYTGNYFHSKTLTGLAGGFHIYFVRCRDSLGVYDAEDYPIYFYIEAFEGESGTGDSSATTTYDGTEGSTGDGEGSSETNDGGSGGGSGGGGGGGGGSATGTMLPFQVPPGDPAIKFFGYSYPSSRVSFLIDGVLKQTVIANSAGVFNINVEEIPRGLYTFGFWAEDVDGNKSTSYNSTFYVEEGTKSSVSDIFLSPTINTSSKEINPGDSMQLRGYGVFDTQTEVWFYPYIDRNLRSEEIIKQQIDAGAGGLWNMILNTNNALGGQYKLKARSYKEGVGYSEFSNILSIGVGEKVEEEVSECANGDLNGDKRVNITDFSIMLYHWGGNNTCADQNNSGRVDLTDFSIMMFYWTG